MTEAEKMAEEIGYPGDPDIIKLIHAVAERTREECCKKMGGASYWSQTETCRAIRNAKWEEAGE